MGKKSPEEKAQERLADIFSIRKKFRVGEHTATSIFKRAAELKREAKDSGVPTKGRKREFWAAAYREVVVRKRAGSSFPFSDGTSPASGSAVTWRNWGYT